MKSKRNAEDDDEEPKKRVKKSTASTTTRTTKQKHSLSVEDIEAIEKVMIFDTCQIVRTELDNTFPKAQFSKYFLKRLTELSMSIADVLAKDSEAFALHAKRNTILTDDLFLGLRHSPHLIPLIHFAQNQGMKLSPKVLEKIESDPVESISHEPGSPKNNQ